MALLMDSDTYRRRAITPFVSDKDSGVIATPPKSEQPQSSFGVLKRNVSNNARALGNFFAGVRRVANREPGTPASQLLGERLAAGAAASSQPPRAAPAGGNTSANAPVLFNPSFATKRAQGATPDKPRGVPAGQIPVAPNIRPAVETGVTLPDGRKLPYGAMVNGVPTFSDGSGGFAGHEASIPRTMTDAEIAGLGDRLNVVPASTFTRPVPAFNSDNTEANVAGILRSRQGGKFGITPEQNAAADIAAVSNQDARTTLGRAAITAGRRANAATTTLQRKAALDDLAGLREGAVKNAALGLENAGALERTNAAAVPTLQRQALANEGALAQQALENEGAMDRTDLAGKYGVASALASARSRTGLTEKDLNAGAIKLLPQVLGLNPAGMIEDPSAPGGMRPPNEQEIAAAMQRAKAIIQGGIAPSTPSAAGAPKAGVVVSGYRFKGGNPNDQANWEKVG